MYFPAVDCNVHTLPSQVTLEHAAIGSHSAMHESKLVTLVDVEIVLGDVEYVHNTVYLPPAESV